MGSSINLFITAYSLSYVNPTKYEPYIAVWIVVFFLRNKTT